MKTFSTFHVGYDFGPNTQAVWYEIKAASYPHACAKCAKAHRGCRILGGSHGDKSGVIRYEGVSTIAVVAEPIPEMTETTFPFLSECRGKRRYDMPNHNGRPTGIQLS